jgi:serine protease Do
MNASFFSKRGEMRADRVKVKTGYDRCPQRRYSIGFLVVVVIVAAAVSACTALLISGLITKPISTEQVAQRICPSIVGVIQYQQGTIGETGEGSGIIMSQDGFIITNNHVIDGAIKLEVVASNGKKYEAKPVGSDARTDIAVIKINGTGFKAASFGNSDDCQVGQRVVAVGNPSGIKLAGSVTQGIISAIDRDIDVGNGPMSLIQTDAAINPGNSGGALVDMNGNVIGINSAKIAQQGYEGIGFSIPISTAMPIVNSIIKYGYVKGRVKFGFNCRSLDSVTARVNNVPVGVFIDSVDPASNAAKSGVQAGDIITAVGSSPTPTTEELLRRRDSLKPGDTVALTIYRRSTCGTLIVNVTLMEDKGLADKNGDNW